MPKKSCNFQVHTDTFCGNILCNPRRPKSLQSWHTNCLKYMNWLRIWNTFVTTVVDVNSQGRIWHTITSKTCYELKDKTQSVSDDDDVWKRYTLHIILQCESLPSWHKFALKFLPASNDVTNYIVNQVNAEYWHLLRMLE